MWYFTWMLGIGFAVLLAILNAMWGDNEDARQQSRETAAARDGAAATADPGL